MNGLFELSIDGHAQSGTLDPKGYVLMLSGQIILKTLVLVRSPKVSSVERDYYLDGTGPLA